MPLKDAKKFMRLAIKEAARGIGKTEPNPAVGCVIVKNNKVVGKGFHKQFGGEHAEIAALKEAGKKAVGASCYVSLEPCSYHGKTPPCADAIIKSGIRELVCAVKDPNPLNNGKGLRILKQNNINVRSGVLKKEAESLNTNFFIRMRKKRPLITLKLAQSLDGKIATRKGDSKWISSAKSRKIVQDLRRKHDAVLVGVNTVIQDNPLLTIRDSKRQPVKIIVDSTLKTPLKSKILSRLSTGKTIMATTKYSAKSRESALRKRGADIIRVGNSADKVDLKALMKELSYKGIGSILVEGGSEIAASFLKKRLVDKLYLFIAPIVIGGRDATSAIGGIGVSSIEQAMGFKEIKTKRIGRDILVEAECLQA